MLFPVDQFLKAEETAVLGKLTIIVKSDLRRVHVPHMGFELTTLVLTG